MTTTREQALTEVNNMMMEAVEYCRLHSVQVSVFYELSGGDVKMAFNANPGFMLSHAERITGVLDRIPAGRISFGRRLLVGLGLFWSFLFSRSKHLPK